MKEDLHSSLFNLQSKKSAPFPVRFLQFLAEHGAVCVKEGQGLQVDDVVAVDGVALGQDGHAAADDTAGLLGFASIAR